MLYGVLTIFHKTRHAKDADSLSASDIISGTDLRGKESCWVSSLDQMTSNHLKLSDNFAEVENQ